MDILVIGAGFVGVTTALTFAELGHKVICIDTDKEKIRFLQEGTPYFYEPDLEPMLHKHLQNGNINFSTRIEGAALEANIVFICVGTPALQSGGADLQFVKQVAETMGQTLNGHKTIVIKSTVPVGTCRKVQGWIERAVRTTHSFDIVSNPEFLREGNALFDSLHPYRVIIGSTNPVAAARVESLFKPLNCPIIHTNPQTAELIKYASNSFLATKISYMNELARFCDTLQLNIRDVALGMGFDPRIGHEFLDAGVGYGGSCFPKDVQALLAMADQFGVRLSLLDQVQQVNSTQYRYFLDKIERKLGCLDGKVVAVLGLAFKPNTSDIREAPALSIIRYLADRGVHIRVHDPIASLPSWLTGIGTGAEAGVGDKFGGARGGVQQCESADEAAANADAVVISTDWPEYRDRLDWGKVKSAMRNHYIFDGRNMLNCESMRALGFTYEGIGYA